MNQSKLKTFEFEVGNYKTELISILEQINKADHFNHKVLRQILQKFPKDGNAFFSKDNLVRGYKYLTENNLFKKSEELENRIKMKPTRTLSGVVPVTVLTKPFHCPGKCIFCPLERNMPKSYLRDEPGCQRAERNNFSPYMQVYSRLLAFQNIGHNTSKVELIVLGGTWSYYPKPYQVWFVKELFRALNDFGINQPAKEFEPKGPQVREVDRLWSELEAEQVKNETAKARSVGLSIETRPDFVTEEEVTRLRKLGCTKIQIGVQSADDKVLEINKRGHKHKASIQASEILRRAGFKIQIHYMPNLHGSTPEIDIEGYKKLFKEKDVLPDELKLYPTSIIKNTELYDIWQRGEYQPYDEQTLLKVLIECLKSTKEFTRLSRVIRDIPSTYIEAGNKKTNFREMAEREITKLGDKLVDIRFREIKNEKFNPDELTIKKTLYKSGVSNEQFLQFVTPHNKIVGFLRLSLPNNEHEHFIDELIGSALIREIHVYGTSLNINDSSLNKPQHLGLGTSLIKEASSIAKSKGFKKLAVISAIGTREYYRKKGFSDGKLYQFIDLTRI